MYARVLSVSFFFILPSNWKKTKIQLENYFFPVGKLKWGEIVRCKIGREMANVWAII